MFLSARERMFHTGDNRLIYFGLNSKNFVSLCGKAYKTDKMESNDVYAQHLNLIRV